MKIPQDQAKIFMWFYFLDIYALYYFLFIFFCISFILSINILLEFFVMCSTQKYVKFIFRKTNVFSHHIYLLEMK